MMTKWDTIQADLEPITPKYWTDEEEIEVSLDELLENTEKELAELENDLTLSEPDTNIKTYMIETTELYKNFNR